MMAAVGSPRAPQSLNAAGKRFWQAIVAVYELSPGEVELLRQASGLSTCLTGSMSSCVTGR